MDVYRVPIGELSLDPANARKHDDRNLESIIASLRRFGQQTPIVVDASNVIRKGNGTYLAARELAWEEIEVVYTDLQSADAIAYAIADNRTSDLSFFDDDILRSQLEGLDDELQFAAGYTQEDIDNLIDSYADDDDDDIAGPETHFETFQVIVECADEESQRRLFERMQSEGHKVKCLQV
jgi:ParB-like chromosome segregation protein Spo0J